MAWKSRVSALWLNASRFMTVCEFSTQYTSVMDRRADKHSAIGVRELHMRRAIKMRQSEPEPREYESHWTVGDDSLLNAFAHRRRLPLYQLLQLLLKPHLFILFI